MNKIRKVLVANRSEIAVRIIRGLQELGIKTVAIYSEIDKNALHTQVADEAVLIGKAPANESYLNQDRIIEAALKTECDAIHPGYGFLSEKYDFNQKVRDSGLIFIGPNPLSMKLLGSKVESRITMIEAGIPVCPGMKGSSKDFEEFEKVAQEIGFPVLVKASDGGGGKGMRIVRELKDLKSSVEAAMRESISSFGSDVIFLEKYIESPRHIEFQVAGDHYGNAIHLFERECSIQRRHQKIIEETPSPILDSELRKKMGETAVKVIKASNYDNVGTVEFLLDKDKNFYFLEVNARIQVEHPITEMTTGVDLLKLQVHISEGKELPFKQEDLVQRGHSLECRIYAEDPDNSFMPSPGKIHFLKEPTGIGVRYDSGITQNSEVSIYYDPILAKLITYGQNREESRIRMINALKENVILGVKTSIPLMIEVLQHKEYISGNISTNFLNDYFSEKIPVNEDETKLALAVAGLTQVQKKGKVKDNSVNGIQSNPWLEIGKWELFS
ncbi:MAG: acetyl-CoA carboxylase biotin carboxylase subunit [Candidatus Kapaibacteriota bacterium]